MKRMSGQMTDQEFRQWREALRKWWCDYCVKVRPAKETT